MNIVSPKKRSWLISNGVKKTFLVVGCTLLSFAPHVLAEGFTALAPIPGLTSLEVTSAIGENTLADFFNNLYKYLIGLAAALAVIQIIWAGISIALNKDSVSEVMSNKGRINQAIFGLILVLSPVLVFSIINPSILNLSLNLPKIDTTPTNSPTSGGSISGNVQTTTDQASGCSVTGDANIMQIAQCQSGAATIAWGQSNCSGGILSSVTAITKNADGTPAQSSIRCTKSNVFEFIDIHTGAAFPPNQITPLAIASNSRINGSDTIYQTNGVDAVRYATICNSVGLKTCISGLPSSPTTFSHTCSPLPSTPLPAAAPSPAKCYTETLSCEDASVANIYCVSSPSWTPFQ